MKRRQRPGEYVIVRARQQGRCLVRPIVLGLILTGASAFWLGWTGRASHPPGLAEWLPVLVPAVLVVLGLIFLRWVFYPLTVWANTRYTLTNQRLALRSGVLARHESDLPLNLIVHIAIVQSLADRFFGGGTLIVDLGHDRVVPYRNVPHVQTFKEYVMEAVEELPMSALFDGVDMDVQLGRDAEWMDDDGR